MFVGIRQILFCVGWAVLFGLFTPVTWFVIEIIASTNPQRWAPIETALSFRERERERCTARGVKELPILCLGERLVTITALVEFLVTPHKIDCF